MGPAVNTGRPTPAGLFGKVGLIYQASTEVTTAIFFAATIIIAGFLPLFTLSGVEGHIFGPMAKTYAYALAGGPLLATFTVSPALSALLLPEKVAHAETKAVRALSRGYARLREFVLGRMRPPSPPGIGLVVLAIVAASSIGLEFLPALEEGNMWVRATNARLDLARSRKRLRQPHAQADQGLPRGGGR